MDSQELHSFASANINEIILHSTCKEGPVCDALYLSHATVGNCQVGSKHFGLNEENTVKKQPAKIYLLSIFNRLSTVVISSHSFLSC